MAREGERVDDVPERRHLAEIRRGILLLDPGRRRRRLLDWLEQDPFNRFAGRILPVDVEVALGWSDLMADTQIRGRPIDAMDAFIAATSLKRRLTLVTRNIRHFAHLGIDILCPWDASA